VEKERLEEDPVRILRAAKLCAELGLTPVGDKVDGLLLLRQVNEGELYQGIPQDDTIPRMAKSRRDS